MTDLDRKIAPFGTWPSPISPALLVEQAVGLADASVSGDRVYWIESRPSEAGRQVLVSKSLADRAEPVDETMAGFSVRTQVHEYGGRCYAVRDGTIVFSNWTDQRLWSVRPGAPPEPITPDPGQPRADRFADPVITADGRWVLCIHEHHEQGGHVENAVVAVALDPVRLEQPVAILAEGHDFFAAPRLSPDGSRLAWINWDLPDMSWDASELWVAEFDPDVPGLGPARRVAGGPGEAVTQPRWAPSGVLHYLSDRTGWWNIYDESGAAIWPAEAEFGEPDWVFGNAHYGFTIDGQLIATWSADGGKRLGFLRDGRGVEVDFPFSSYSSVVPSESGVVAVAASPVLPPSVVLLDLQNASVQVLRRSRQIAVDDTHLSRPRAVEFPTGDGQVAHALFYGPAHAEYRGPQEETPPLIVIIHGGPTSSTSAVLNLSVQYWTNRGFAVADVDYRGSSGYGRAYRRMLDGAWGIADVEDCAAVVAWLDSQGLADGHRALIRGGSAGGFTTLAALAFTDRFAAGSSLFGVADLELLARDTHKFESRYLDSLVGPWPAAVAEYRRRSPIHHVDQITSPLILFQGLEDMVVPPAQSELMFQALQARGVPVAYLAFEGEQHGFRQAETVMAVARAELEFYGRVLGFRPAPTGGDGGPALEIANEDALSPRY